MNIQDFFFIAYGILQLFSFAIYGLDKYKAKAKSRRISEKFLLAIAVFAPFGAYMAMHIFRHKTKKLYFWLVTIGMSILHAVAAMLYFYSLKS